MHLSMFHIFTCTSWFLSSDWSICAWPATSLLVWIAIHMIGPSSALMLVSDWTVATSCMARSTYRCSLVLGLRSMYNQPVGISWKMPTVSSYCTASYVNWTQKEARYSPLWSASKDMYYWFTFPYPSMADCLAWQQWVLCFKYLSCRGTRNLKSSSQPSSKHSTDRAMGYSRRIFCFITSSFLECHGLDMRQGNVADIDGWERRWRYHRHCILHNHDDHLMKTERRIYWYAIAASLSFTRTLR